MNQNWMWFKTSVYCTYPFDSHSLCRRICRGIRCIECLILSLSLLVIRTYASPFFNVPRRCRRRDTKWNEKANERKTNNRDFRKEEEEEETAREINNIWNRYIMKTVDDELHTCSGVCVCVYVTILCWFVEGALASVYNKR